MRFMRTFLALGALLAATALAHAQGSVLQGGTWTPGHLPQYSGSGSSQAVVSDGGGAGGGAAGVNPGTLGITARGTGTPPYIAQGKGPNGSNFCMYDAPTTNAAGYHYLCMDPNIGGLGTITYGAGGVAAAQSLAFVINGTPVIIPTGGGGTIPQITTPQVNGGAICATGTAGNLTGCVGTQYGVVYYSTTAIQSSTAAGINGQLLLGATAGAPVWQTMSGDASITTGGVATVAKVNGVAYPASPTVNTVPYVSGTNQITYGTLPVAAGGSGAATFTAHGILLGQGTGAVTSSVNSNIGYCFLSQGLSSDPIWAACASGAGSAGGSNTQVQYNAGSSLAGSVNFTWVSPTLTIGLNAAATGQIALANGGALGTSVTIQNLGNTTPYNFNLPITAGTTGQPMLSAGGGAASMTFGTLGVSGGGTNCSAASGTCLDNITGFASTGYINRTGAGTYVFQPQITLANGGTSASLVASNGGIFYSTASAGAILSGTATANQVLLSGATAAPSWSNATYPVSTSINQILYSSAANVIAGLATGNNSILATGGTGIPVITSTIPSAVQLNITSVGTVTAGTWQATPVALLYGGTNAALTASNGGIFYSTATAGAILSGTATASLPLLSGSTAAPTWATVSHPTSATSGGVAYFSSTTVMASSGLLTANAIVLGGGAGAAPTTLGSLGTTTTVLHGNAAGAPTFGAISLTADVSGILPPANGGTGVANSKNLTVSNSMTLAAGADAQTWTFPAVSDTIGGLATSQTWTAQNTHNVARTITSATAATLRDLYVQAATTTITGNTGSPITSLSKVYFGQPTLTDASAVTVTDAATLYIDNAPAAAGSVTITNAWAIQVAAGNVKFAGTGNNVGTITTGTWNGSIVIATYGGTNNAFFQVSGPTTSIKTYTFPNSSQTMAALDLADQTLSGGANVTSSNQGTKSSGTFTVDCGASPLQYITNGGAFTLAAPANDGSCIVRSVNNGSAGTITFSGFTIGSNTGDALTTTNTSAFAIQIWRINGVSRYLISAYQ